ncbi:MAG TPA: hypothetical protein DCR14_17085, partial [Acidimicrobiaceae bacterium]|nr:hypothetical protein [Acidimicrobiaceae bacterium]
PSRGARPAPDARSRRDQAGAELREAVEGREDELWGIGLIGAGVLFGLAIYLELAGPLGRGLSTVVGWFTGLGRYVVPVCLVGVGVALVRKGRSGHRFRLAIGWAVTGLSILGVLHVVRRADDGFDSLDRAGGWFGAMVGEPLRSLLADAGAIVVLAALFLGGVMLITRASVRTLFQQSAKGVGAVAVPLGRRVRSTFNNMSTLRSERDATNELPPPSPVLYDLATDDDWAAAEPPLPKPRASRSAKQS